MKLIIITRGYPVNTEELSFLKQELEITDRYFQIILIPKFNLVELDFSSSRYPVVECNCKINTFNKLKYAVLGLIDIRLWREIEKFIIKRNIKIDIFKQIITEMALSKRLDSVLNKVINRLDNKEQVIVYSYWYDYSLLSATKIKNKNVKVITRAHGFDLYNERCATGTQVFKEQLDKHIDRILFISQYGKEYYCKNYKKDNFDKCKYIVNYLGVREQVFKPYVSDKVFHLVSCSNVIAIKRIDKVIEALAGIDNIEIEWTHIGSGETIEQIQSLAKSLLDFKSNIKYSFVGNLLSDDVMEIYNNQYFDCFILISETEGLPVSIMEAMSFGIPVIANDVGGIKEIINENNGYLISSYENVEAITKTIEEFYFLSESRKEQLRENAYNTWKEKFSAYANAMKLVNIIQTLS